MQHLHLTPKETAEFLRIPEGRLARWRTQGGGPRFIKLGRAVFYSVKEIDAFLEKQTRESTSQRVN